MDLAYSTLLAYSSHYLFICTYLLCNNIVDKHHLQIALKIISAFSRHYSNFAFSECMRGLRLVSESMLN